MKGYYIIPCNGDMIECIGKNARTRAIKKAKQIIIEQNDESLIIQQFDDNNKNGYMDGLEYLSIEKIMNIST